MKGMGVEIYDSKCVVSNGKKVKNRHCKLYEEK